MPDFTAIPLNITPGHNPVIERVSETLEQSIDSILELIIFTPKGSSAADPDFGFEYWNHEFSNINIREFNNSYLGMSGSLQPVEQISRKQCETSIKDSILAYEPRLLRPEVKIVMEMSSTKRKRNSMSKYEMTVLITGSIDDGLGITRQYEKRISFMVEPTAKKA